jgi:integrase
MPKQKRTGPPRAGRTQPARKLTTTFVENAPDGDWPDTLAVGLTLCVSNSGKGKSWEFRYTSPTVFMKSPGGMSKNKLAKWRAEHPNDPQPPDKKKYKRRGKGLGSVKAAKGGISLDEARQIAIQSAIDVRKGIDPIDAATKAEFENEARAGEALTVFDALKEYKEKVYQYESPDYRNRNQPCLNRLHDALNTIPIKTLAEHPELIVDKLGMAAKWHDHRDVEEKVLLHLRRAISRVMGRCKITSNPAIVKGCLEHHGLSLKKTKKKGHYVGLPYDDVGRLMDRLRKRVTLRPGTNPVGQRSTLNYALEFILLTAVREGEVFRAEWKEFDEERAIWIAPLSHLKKTRGGNFERPVPITKEMQDVLDAMRARHIALRGKEPSPDDLVFPSPAPNKKGELWQPMTRTSITRHLNELWPEYKIHVHGIRFSARSWANGPIGRKLGHTKELMDRQQGRREKGVGGSAYSSEVRPELDDETFDDRKPMMRDWCRYINKVNPLSAASERMIRNNQKAAA